MLLAKEQKRPFCSALCDISNCALCFSPIKQLLDGQFLTKQNTFYPFHQMYKGCLLFHPFTQQKRYLCLHFLNKQIICVCLKWPKIHLILINLWGAKGQKNNYFLTIACSVSWVSFMTFFQLSSSALLYVETSYSSFLHFHSPC